MRVLVIEKKIARKYDPEIDKDPSSEPNGSQDEEQQDQPDPATETTPLISSSSPPKSYYTLPDPSTLSKFYLTFPLLLTLSDPQLLTALLLSFVQAFLLGTFDATVPQFASETFSFAALKAGLLFLPLGVFDFILGPVFGWAVDRYSTKPVAVGSYLFLVPVLACMHFADQHLAVYAALLALCGVGLAGVGAPGIVEAGAVVERYYEGNRELFGGQGPYAQLYGCTNLFFSLGLTLGPEFAGELKEKIGYGNMNAVLAGICAVTALLSFYFIGGRISWGKKAD
jgi:MFS family permease